MVKLIGNFIEFEKVHLLKMPGNSLRAMTTFILYGLCMPVLELFTSAFLWRQTNSISHVAIYYVSIFSTMYLTFIANTFLLKFIPIQRLFALGTLLRGTAVVVLMSVPNLSITTLVLLGLFTGVTSGLLWSNRNYINLKSTTEDYRDYFNSMVSVVDTISGILVPLVAGWFISLATTSGILPTNTAYLILGGIVFFVLAIAAFISLKISVPNPQEKLKIMFNVSKEWWLIRAITLANGTFQGISFSILGAIILKYAGGEATLGTLQSAAALIGAVLLYSIGKKISARHRIQIIFFRAFVITIGTLILLFNLNAFGVTALIISIAITQPFWASAVFSLWHRTIETDSAKSGIGANNYLLDLEFFINLGRGSLLLIFVVISNTVNENTAMLIALMVVIASQIVLAIANFLLRKLNK